MNPGALTGTGRFWEVWMWLWESGLIILTLNISSATS